MTNSCLEEPVCEAGARTRADTGTGSGGCQVPAGVPPTITVMACSCWQALTSFLPFRNTQLCCRYPCVTPQGVVLAPLTIVRDGGKKAKTKKQLQETREIKTIQRCVRFQRGKARQSWGGKCFLTSHTGRLSRFAALRMEGLELTLLSHTSFCWDSLRFILLHDAVVLSSMSGTRLIHFNDHKCFGNPVARLYVYTLIHNARFLNTCIKLI